MSDTNNQTTEATPQPKLPLRQRLIGTLAAFLGTGAAALLVHVLFYNLPNATSVHQELLGLHPVIVSGLYVLLGTGLYALGALGVNSALALTKNANKVTPHRRERFATILSSFTAMLLMLESFSYDLDFGLIAWIAYLYFATFLACYVSNIVKDTFGKQYRWLPLMSKFLQDGN